MKLTACRAPAFFLLKTSAVRRPLHPFDAPAGRMTTNQHLMIRPVWPTSESQSARAQRCVEPRGWLERYTVIVTDMVLSSYTSHTTSAVSEVDRATSIMYISTVVAKVEYFLTGRLHAYIAGCMQA